MQKWEKVLQKKDEIPCSAGLWEGHATGRFSSVPRTFSLGSEVELEELTFAFTSDAG